MPEPSGSADNRFGTSDQGTTYTYKHDDRYNRGDSSKGGRRMRYKSTRRRGKTNRRRVKTHRRRHRKH
jgi:hypothetical protein